MKSQVQAFTSSFLFKNKGSNTFCICIKFPHVNIDKKNLVCTVNVEEIKNEKHYK